MTSTRRRTRSLAPGLVGAVVAMICAAVVVGPAGAAGAGHAGAGSQGAAPSTTVPTTAPPPIEPPADTGVDPVVPGAVVVDDGVTDDPPTKKFVEASGRQSGGSRVPQDAARGTYWVNFTSHWKVPAGSRVFFTYLSGNCVDVVNPLKFDTGPPVYDRRDALFTAKNSGACWWEFTHARFAVTVKPPGGKVMARTIVIQQWIAGNYFYADCAGGGAGGGGGNLPCKFLGNGTREAKLTFG